MKSLRLRLAVSVITVSVVVTGVLAALLYLQVSQKIRADNDRRLAEDAKVLAGLIEFERNEGLELELIAFVPRIDRDRSTTTAWRLWTADGELVAEAPGTEWMKLPAAATAAPTFDDAQPPTGPSLRVVSWAFKPRLDEDEPAAAIADAPRLVIAVGRATRPVDDLLADVARLFWLLGTSACLLVGGVAAWQVARGFAPVARLAADVEQAEATGAHATLDTTGLPAELVPLVSRLNSVVAKLRGALHREREFSGHVAHELRTPLTVIRTGLELAMRKNGTTPEVTQRLDDLLETVDEMSRLVENLLLLARVERGAETTQLQRVSVAPIVDSIQRRFALQAEERGLSFENRIPADHEVQADAGKLHIVLQNLIGNAVSYTERGGQIVVDAAEGEVVSVWDSGPQLATAELERVFDRLWRADQARTDATQHAGLGLSLARALCRHMRLDLTAQNVPAGGLRFVVTTKR